MLVTGLKLKGIGKGINALSCEFHLYALFCAALDGFRIAWK